MTAKDLLNRAKSKEFEQDLYFLELAIFDTCKSIYENKDSYSVKIIKDDIDFHKLTFMQNLVDLLAYINQWIDINNIVAENNEKSKE